MKDYILKKPHGIKGYDLHRVVTALLNGAPHLWRDNGETLFIRTTAILDADGQATPIVEKNEIRIFTLRACVSSKTRGHHVYPALNDHVFRKNWLEKQALRNGFQLVSVHSVAHAMRVVDHKGRDFTVDCTDFTGALKVIDPTVFQAALLCGVGSTGKTFGFSLLSI
jgi:hypothetical protein